MLILCTSLFTCLCSVWSWLSDVIGPGTPERHKLRHTKPIKLRNGALGLKGIPRLGNNQAPPRNYTLGLEYELAKSKIKEKHPQPHQAGTPFSFFLREMASRCLDGLEMWSRVARHLCQPHRIPIIYDNSYHMYICIERDISQHINTSSEHMCWMHH